METILVTGGLGYIGSHICVELLNNNYNVIVVDNLCNSDYSIVEQIEQITNKTFTFYCVDMNDDILLNNVFKNHVIDVVIHLAALKNVNESINKPLCYYNDNVVGTIHLLKLMERYNVNNIIFSSSATVYKPTNSILSEDCELGPINPYGNTKWMIETILQDCKINATVLRYFNPIGNHESGLLYNHNGSNVMPMIGKVLNEGGVFSIFGNDYDTKDGTCIRDYIHVIDVAKAHLVVMHQQGFHIYNIGTGIGTSVLELAEKMGVAWKIGQRREGDAPMSVCDPSKIYKELGWKTEFTINDMCRTTLKGINK